MCFRTPATVTVVVCSQGMSVPQKDFSKVDWNWFTLFSFTLHLCLVDGTLQASLMFL